MSFLAGDKVAYRHFREYAFGAPQMMVEFVESDRVTCSYVELDGAGNGVVRVITLNERSLDKVPD